MKKLIVCIMAFAFLLTTTAPAFAKGGHGGGGKGGSGGHSSSHSGGGKGHSGGGKGHGGGPSRGHGGGGGHYHSSSSTSVYLVGREVIPNVHTFPDCNQHSATSETFVSYYSNGTSNSYTYYTVLDAKGNVLATDCTDVKHTFYDNVHYLLLRKGGKYGIYSHDGQ